ncbi:hypothetical protein H4684_002335 [Desulfomicrobium macestii]|uniref:Uncharacterized protein n=2 Tax=Desulfomicrobium TaxID=898 RepID=A0A8G2C213_DESNO|nr:MULTISPECIES: hypothetical protein [Desulfomicrobium]MBE1425678.1 hypothetical protein [Desulfomicrobium macestii]SFL57261.1 hypothetical protein SAMN05421830_103331 [Desulfomicrobium norvegicum]
MTEKSLPVRLKNFVLTMGAALAFVYLFLPFLTNSCGVLSRMSSYLDDNGIDPTRYYYTDVAQVKEGEDYLRFALEEK